MPYKNQSLCYRTINGVRYVNWCDVIGPEEERTVASVKRRGFPHRLVKHQDGFKMLFVAESIPIALAFEADDTGAR